MHRVILCADDYGLAPGVGASIRELIVMGRLSATSCMTVCPFWPDEAERLKPLADRADIGLHLTLTDHTPLGAMPSLAPRGRLPPLKALMGRAFAGQLDGREIAGEVARQVAAFTTAFGRPPDYIDGHQHVHQLPTVREAVATALVGLPGTYVRLCVEPRRAILRRGVSVAKALLISELGTGLAALAKAAGIPANAGFRGVYDFSGAVPFGTLMERFLEPPGTRPIVMVHPGIPDDALRRADPVVDQRLVEHEYLRGEAFGDLLVERALRPSRLRDFPGARPVSRGT